MVPQPQFELGKVPETQSGTWGNLVPHMCKSHQTTSVKRFLLSSEKFLPKELKIMKYVPSGVFYFIIFQTKKFFSATIDYA